MNPVSRTRSLRDFCAIHLPECIILIVGIASFLAIWPFGEYTVLDDWAFALSLRHLHEDGRLIVMDWVPMTLIGHLLWGWLFTCIFGFSLTVAKISVGIAGVVCVLSLQKCLRKSSLDRPVTLLAGLTLLLNPLYLFHSSLFMTDVTSLTFIWLTILCWTYAIFAAIRVNLMGLAVGSCFAGMAFLTRQHGIALPIAIVAYAAWHDRRLLRPTSFLATIAPCVALIVIGSIWSSSSSQSTSQFRVASNLVREFCLSPPWTELPYIFWSYCVYAGLFVGPVLLATIRVQPIIRSRTILSVGLTLMAIGIGYWLYATFSGWRFPYVPNVITQFGMFHPNEFVLGDRPILWGKGMSGFVGELGAIAACGLVCSVVSFRKGVNGDADACRQSSDACRTRLLRFLLILFVLQFAYVFATSPIVFDRHLLVFAPTAIAVTALCGGQLVARRLPIAALWVLSYAAYGIACSHDIHAISREAFFAGDDLHREGIPLENIDAGYAFDGWYMYEQSQLEFPTEMIVAPPWWPNNRARDNVATFGQPWWVGYIYRKIEPEYAISISRPLPIGSYGDRPYAEIECSRSYRTYWPFQVNPVYSFKHRKHFKTPAK